MEVKNRSENEIVVSIPSRTKGERLVSVNREGKYICDCEGFHYRKRCSHGEMAVRWLEVKESGFLKKKGVNLNFLPSSIPSLDELLGGGLPLKMITQIFGPPRVNKSPLVLQVASQYPSIFISTECVVPSPWTDVWMEKFAERFDVELKVVWKYLPDIKDLLEYLGAKCSLEYSEKGKAELVIEERIWESEKTQIGKDLQKIGGKVIVIDSLSAPLKESFTGRVNFPARSNAASIILGMLRRACEKFDATALVVNHESRDPARPYENPDQFGSYAIDYNIKFAVYLDRFGGKDRSKQDRRYLWLERHPYKEEWVYKKEIKICDDGFHEVEESL